MDMVKIRACSVNVCAYNREKQCRTMAITVGPHAECNTFIHASPRAGFPEISGGIGACQASSCKWNSSLECQAPAVNVATDERHADCRTFEQKK
jgi:hypothetical protein